MHKTKMYECTAFFPSGHPKKWKYVRDLKSFSNFLTKDHPSWKYFNVYEKGTKIYLKRFYPGNLIPKILGILLFIGSLSNPYENTSNKTTRSKTTLNTSINGFNYYATIASPNEAKKEGLC